MEDPTIGIYLSWVNNMIDDLINKWEVELEKMSLIDPQVCKYIEMFLKDLRTLEKMSAKTIDLFGEVKL